MKLPLPVFNVDKLNCRSACHCLLLLIWIGVGAGLRLINLTAKPPWMDEVATVIFSLGNSSRTIPLDRAISLDVLLQPLQPDPDAGLGSVIQHLFEQDNHPPLYFMLAHGWMKLFPAEDGVASVWAARSLPVLLGVIAIPATFVLGWLAFRSRLVGQLAAAMMVVSPYGIYLAQEARHYTLAILFVIASLCCLVIARQAIDNRRPLPLWVGLVWVVVNSLGIAVHYFFALTLAAEALVLISLRLGYWRQGCQGWRIYAVGAGTLCGGLLWLPAWQSFYGSEQTTWLSMGEHRSLLELINPIFQALAGWITMLILLPVETKNLLVVVSSVLVMLIFLIWALPILSRGLKRQFGQSETRLAAQTVGGFVLAAIALFFIISYGPGIDITRGSRYNFVYFPGVIVLLGASLSTCWNAPAPSKRTQHTWLQVRGRKAVMVIWLMGLLSALTVAGNLGFGKFYRPERLISIIQQESRAPVLIASTVHKTDQASIIAPDLIGLAWEIKRNFRPRSQAQDWTPQFLLAQYNQNPQTAAAALLQTMTQLPRPLDLWLVNFGTAVELNTQHCFAHPHSVPSVGSYHYQHYQCPGNQAEWDSKE